MANLRRVLINVHRVLNSMPIPNNSSIQAASNPLLRPHYGYALVSRFTSQSNDTQSLDIDLSNEESKRRLFNRLLYRSKQRGFLELDLVLGKWVEENIHSMNESRIKALIHVLDVSHHHRDLKLFPSLHSSPQISCFSRNHNLILMANLRRVLINVHRVLNSMPIPNNSSIQAASNPLLRPYYGYALVSRFTSQSNDTQSLDIDLSNEESKRRLFNRLLYRSKQRGFLELDLVLGKWVEENIHSMNESRIKALIHVLDVENPDLWSWVSGQEQPPATITSNPVFAAVHDRVMKNLDSHSAPETRATPGQPWVRGWDDIKKGRGGPIVGNQ